MSVSDSLVFMPKPASVKGTTHRQTVPAYNGSSFKGQQTILINIPTGRRGHYLNTRMSYLRFKVTNNHSTAGMSLDYSASCFIQSLALYHGSNLLEQIHEYNALYHFLLDMQGSEESVERAGSILQGSASGREGRTIAAAGEVYFCIPVLSGVIGPLQSKYMPLGQATGGDLRLELTLAAANTAVVSTSDADWAISDVELNLEFVEIDSEVDRMIQQANQRYVISCESFANYTNTIEAASSAKQNNLLIPARFSSLKTLYTFFRLQEDVTKKESKSVSARPYPTLKNWYYQVSGENIPSTPVRETVESFAELQKALHTFGAADNTSLITEAIYTEASGATTNAGFAIGQNLETLSHKSTLTESGKNTLNTNCYLLGETNINKNLQVSTFAHFDMVLVLENGVFTAAF
jgi:hypothetical protein